MEWQSAYTLLVVSNRAYILPTLPSAQDRTCNQLIGFGELNALVEYTNAPDRLRIYIDLTTTVRAYQFLHGFQSSPAHTHVTKQI